MSDEFKEKIEVWAYGLVVFMWVGYTFVSDVIKAEWLVKIEQAKRLDWGMIVIATILYMLLRKVLSLKRQNRAVQIFPNFSAGINMALTGRRHISIDIFALSTQTFLHHMAYNNELTFGLVRILMPTDSAIAAFYASHHGGLGLNSNSAITVIGNQIAESIQMWNGLKAGGRVGELHIKRIELFPTSYLAIIDGATTFAGNYYLSGLSTHHGLSIAESFLYTGNSSPAPYARIWFDSFWKAAA